MSTQQMVHTVITRYAVFPKRLLWQSRVFTHSWTLQLFLHLLSDLRRCSDHLNYSTQFAPHGLFVQFSLGGLCVQILSKAGRCNSTTLFQIEKPTVTPLSLETQVDNHNKVGASTCV